MPYQAPPNRAYGTLGAVYASGGTTLTLASGHGTRFGALPAGSWFWVLIEDKNETVWNRFMIAKVTAIAGDSLAITPAEDGTGNSNFPITGGNPIQKVQVYAGHSIRQLRALIDGGGALVQAAMPTLTVDSPKNLMLNPAVAGILTLPTTGVWAGLQFLITNLGTASITVNASGGNPVIVVGAGQNAEVRASKDSPTAATDWIVRAGLPFTAPQIFYFN